MAIAIPSGGIDHFPNIALAAATQLGLCSTKESVYSYIIKLHTYGVNQDFTLLVREPYINNPLVIKTCLCISYMQLNEVTNMHMYIARMEPMECN